jgi:hypothetical protein|tara:strand:+ start:26318 stop:26890 length:573 start_codon:yes stop_codon:yes gene_type:complete
MAYVTKNAKIEELTSVSQERLLEIDKLATKNKQLKDELAKATTALFELEVKQGRFEEQETSLEACRKSLRELHNKRFQADDPYELREQLSLRDFDVLLCHFLEHVNVVDYDSPFHIAQGENWCDMYEGEIYVNRKIMAPWKSENLYEDSSFAQWLKFAPKNVKHSYDEGDVDEYGNRVQINFWIEEENED